ncbi:hypothetical protein CANARDRAFT_211162 [[Candida] arabinofermentans NRRL YB-2248]|uniref:Uncharacterized protein n=1 Tax=[Candida] arabinofermentans NRRL YB-2248 TaxID=983967 RepID=A0A1E4T4G4_9ASCO|nr:hypothetical protein CANARDRAFT_211162 [[Candida] arabinofermentans NRRL YB-2248]
MTSLHLSIMVNDDMLDPLMTELKTYSFPKNDSYSSPRRSSVQHPSLSPVIQESTSDEEDVYTITKDDYIGENIAQNSFSNSTMAGEKLPSHHNRYCDPKTPEMLPESYPICSYNRFSSQHKNDPFSPASRHSSTFSRRSTSASSTTTTNSIPSPLTPKSHHRRSRSQNHALIQNDLDFLEPTKEKEYHNSNFYNTVPNFKTLDSFNTGLNQNKNSTVAEDSACSHKPPASTKPMDCCFQYSPLSDRGKLSEYDFDDSVIQSKNVYTYQGNNNISSSTRDSFAISYKTSDATDMIIDLNDIYKSLPQ